VEKLGTPKKKDWSERLAALTPFLATVVIAGISLAITYANQRAAAERDTAFHKAQIRVAELEALSKLVPELASKDPDRQKVAQYLLQVVQQTSGRLAPANTSEGSPGAPGHATPPTRTAGGEQPVIAASLIDQFAAKILDPSATSEARIVAAEKIADVASSPGSSPTERRHAEAVLSNVAQSPATPQDLRSAAEKAIANIRQATAGQIADLVKNEPNSRKINEVILHHSAQPIASYKGYQTIKALAMLQTQVFNWDRLGFHYAVAPDGTIWLGTPISQAAFHTEKQNQTSIGVTLIMNGDSELPTVAQRQSVAALLKALFSKSNLTAEANFAPGHGFHSDYSRMKSCPGKLMTKSMVLSWLSEQR